ncbi:MAG: beta-galactosidase, partial [Gemmatimonadaceae bacterium]|nr:beta-galactosidase [Acetobacteraceae bacterium]
MLAVMLTLAGGTAQAARWDDFQLIMWHDHDVVRMGGLARMGFTATKLFGTGGRIDPGGLAARRQAGLPWYVENIATDFYAPYHRYTPGKPVTWLFDAARARRAQAPADRSVFFREPGLSDPDGLARVQARLTEVVRSQAADRPLFYNLGDEVGIGDLSASWDFDIGPASLSGMREWLRTEYADLDALNRQWGSAFAAWDDVVPELTDDAMARTDDNFSAWADFKAWMDVAFARALRAGTDAVHRADPGALSAIEGAQVPGWGGFDYGRIAGAVDVMDIYDSGNNLEIARSLNPALIPLRTVFETGPRATHTAWQNMLRGGRGLIVWDEGDDTVRPDGSPGPRGLALQTLVASLRTVAPALIASPPATSPVAMLYSQASFRTRWMLDQRPRGPAWSDRDAERELDDNAWRASRRQMSQRLVELGLPPRWLSSQGIEAGALQDPALRVLMLPHAIALSDAEVAAIRAFAARGGSVLADTEPGTFDQRSRRRSAS